MEKEVLIWKRKKAKELHEKGWSNRKIAKYLLASKDSGSCPPFIDLKERMQQIMLRKFYNAT